MPRNRKGRYVKQNRPSESATMSTRSVKKTVSTTTVQSSSSSSSSQEKSSPGRMRPPSPARISRLQEKEQMVELNNRLANYIEYIRSLEADNSKLQLQVRQYEETTTREVTNIKDLYEKEMADLRKLVDDLAKEKAKLQIDVGKYKSESEDWMIKFNKRDREANSAEKKIPELEAAAAEAEARASDAEGQKKRAQAELAKVKAELAALERQLTTAKKQLEEETLLRVDLENRLQSLKEELKFNSTLHEQELSETRTRAEVSVEEVDSRVTAMYEGKLAEALEEMRKQHEEHVRLQREELEVLYESKLTDLQQQVERGGTLAEGARSEMRSTRKKFDELNARLTALSTEKAALEGRIRDLEAQLESERSAHETAIMLRMEEVQALRLEMDEMRLEYAELMDIKLALDLEIAAYRKLLEGEESRLNLSVSETTPSRTMQSTSVRSGTKRKRVAVEEASFSSSSSKEFAASSTCKGQVEVSEVNAEGKFIKLYNNSEKEIAIGGWQLLHKAGEQETTYKFHRTVKMEPNGYVTVYSSDAGETHQPPSTLVMKSQRWFISDSMKTTLNNGQGNEEASCEMSRSSIRVMHSGRPRRDDVVEKDRCVVM